MAKDQPARPGARRPGGLATAPAPARPDAAVPLEEAARRLGGDAAEWRAAARLFPVRWPASYLALAEGSGGEAIRLMGAPHPDELTPQHGELPDPVGEALLQETPFVVRKHPDRAILLVTAACHFYCRFCFRRSFPDGSHRSPSAADLDAALEHLAAQADLREVILSGGDPLTLSDERVASIVARAAAIPQVERIRVHSRAPVHEPSRVTQALCDALVEACAGKPLRLVTHPNHAVEAGAPFRGAVATLLDRGVPVLAQSVLLRGVNDAPATLAELFLAIVEAGVEPYYLHHPDRVAGAARFFVSIALGLEIFEATRALVPVSALPSYVIDVPDGSGKVPVESLERLTENRWRAPNGHEWTDVEDERSITG